MELSKNAVAYRAKKEAVKAIRIVLLLTAGLTIYLLTMAALLN